MSFCVLFKILKHLNTSYLLLVTMETSAYLLLISLEFFGVLTSFCVISGVSKGNHELCLWTPNLCRSDVHSIHRILPPLHSIHASLGNNWFGVDYRFLFHAGKSNVSDEKRKETRGSESFSLLQVTVLNNKVPLGTKSLDFQKQHLWP